MYIYGDVYIYIYRGDNITPCRCDCDVKSQRISSCRKRKEAFAAKAKRNGDGIYLQKENSVKERNS